jgi:hypothetical protein
METMSNSRIQKVVLRRARTIAFMRPLISSTALGVVAIVASLYVISREVWVARVLENMPSPTNIAVFFRFFEVAFLNTSFAVQVLTLLMVAGMYWIARDIALQVRIGVRTA